jgi:hypothetical protein
MNSWDIDFYAINQLRENCTNLFYVVVLLTWRHKWTTCMLMVPSVARLSKTPQQWLRWKPKCLATMFCANPAWSIPNNTKTLIFVETWHNTEIRTVRSRLRDRHSRPRRPAMRPNLLIRHRAATLTCCRRHLRFRRQDWANILFTDESNFYFRMWRHWPEIGWTE